MVSDYVAISRRDAIQPAFNALMGIVDDVFPVDIENVQNAKEILLTRKRVSARDALHLAVMNQHGITQILSFDTGLRCNIS